MDSGGRRVTVLEAAAAIRAKKISSRELVETTLTRIARANPSLNAFITVMEDSARARADAMDAELARGIDRGPLHGIPVAHKDLVQTQGVRTTAGSKIFADFVPEKDAVVAARLDAAGAVLVGKTGLHEVAFGITSNNPHYGAIHNPWDLERIPGGSSGGSAAALAAGLLPMATGTDTGGSIRIPASFCGVVGLKPTYERVSRLGVLPLSFTLDHVGPMARTVRDVAVSFRAMAENPGQFAPSGDEGRDVSLRGIRIGVPQNFYFDRVDLEVSGAVRRAVQTAAALGARVVEMRVPDMEALNVIGRIIQLCDAAAIYRPHLDRPDNFGTDVLALLTQGRLIPATDYVDAQRLRKIFAAEFRRLWDEVDCIFAPATPIAAPKIGELTTYIGPNLEDVRQAATRLTRGFNILGNPALALPCGFTKSVLPIGLQIAAAANQEHVLLRVGAAMEDAMGFAGRVAGNF
jgi:aspartyl-tRNA(Asn)/glutamyl-tRNA(Gln) amidotransferase subunit A